MLQLLHHLGDNPRGVLHSSAAGFQRGGEKVAILAFSRETDQWNEREIYYKELAHTIMEAGKFQDLQLAGQRCGSSLKASRLETQEEPTFQMEAGKDQCLSSRQSGSTRSSDSAFLLCRGHQWIG